MPDKEIKFEIIQNLGILSTSPKGWRKEINLISWDGREPKYDIRDWDPEHKRMSKGITLTTEELKKLKEVLNKWN
ncbi:hypothetical protein D2962_05975 [Biomaibacter acetigenes]|uniref:Transcriptional coactivator p15 (PC4) C-terminal domain-containing protein n=1 Tax=Biomaibacter acetigenes TaxID=2316383 RepID=A0A3G2R4F7_9FIRM|nr:PC4/YdbC family ssDNA-binding protein [Biomaibacter acetigenes]AYO30225.1 hypothetical protein D2962_05975 [Biomaibacter acetigenes]